MLETTREWRGSIIGSIPGGIVSPCHRVTVSPCHSIGQFDIRIKVSYQSYQYYYIPITYHTLFPIPITQSPSSTHYPSTSLYFLVLHCTSLYFPVLPCTPLHCPVLHGTFQYYHPLLRTIHDPSLSLPGGPTPLTSNL